MYILYMFVHCRGYLQYLNSALSGNETRVVEEDRKFVDVKMKNSKVRQMMMGSKSYRKSCM